MSLLPHRERPILIAGFGSIGRRHFRNLKQLGYENFLFLRSGRGLLDDAEIAAHPSSSDLSKLLEQKPFAAVISLPSSLHLAVAQESAEADCHLLIEKPLSHSLAGCAQLLETVRARRLTAMVGCQFRFHPLFQTLDEGLRMGRLGRIIGARAEWGEYLPAWHPWEDHRLGYAARGDMGGGVVLTLIHPLDYFHKLFGAPSAIHGILRRVPSLETNCEDWADISLEYASGVVGQIHLDYLQRPPVHELSVCGDQGRAELDFLAGTLRWTNTDGRTEDVLVPANFERNDMFLAETRHFLDCITDGKPTQIPLEDGIAVLHTALAAKTAGIEPPTNQ